MKEVFGFISQGRIHLPKMDIMHREYRLKEIEEEIKKAESQKKLAVLIMFISIFFLWPLLIIGGIMYYNENNKLKELNKEKKELSYQNYYDTL